MDQARLKSDVAFEMLEILGVPYFTFHDADVRPDRDCYANNHRDLMVICDTFEEKMAATGLKLLGVPPNQQATAGSWPARQQTRAQRFSHTLALW